MNAAPRITAVGFQIFIHSICYNSFVRRCFVVGLLALTAAASAQNVEPTIPQGTASASCLSAPLIISYPALALAASIMGPVTATFDIELAGGVTRLEFKGHFLLATGVVEALRSARFDSGCWGRSLSMRFSFRLDQDLASKTPVTVKATSVYEYEIVSPMKLIELSISDPAWEFTRKGRFCIG